VAIPEREGQERRAVAHSGGVPPDARHTATALGDFLRASRGRIAPEDVGLDATGGERRRVSGLRREELALLAGVSASYYTRLEQGHSRGASPQVLDALATALRLDDTERAHLRALAELDARPPRAAPRRARAAEKPDPALLELLAALPDVPALVLGRRNDVLAWNPLGHALLAGHLPPDAPSTPAERPNLTRLVFLDPATRELYVDWRAKARAVVGNLRLTAARDPDDLGLAELIGALCMSSPEFASLWADQRVRPCATAAYALHHPSVGRLTVTQQTLRSAGAPSQSLVTHTAAASSPSAAALALLSQLL
jgi:transcriptional regulator with XRE-family HTH domain